MTAVLFFLQKRKMCSVDDVPKKHISIPSPKKPGASIKEYPKSQSAVEMLKLGKVIKKRSSSD